MANIENIIATDMAATAFDTAAAESPSQDVTYTPPGGDEVTVTAIVLAEDIENTSDELGETKIRRRDIVISTDVVTSPQINASVTIADENWQVVSVSEAGFGKAVLSLVCGAPQSRHHETHKQRFT